MCNTFGNLGEPASYLTAGSLMRLVFNISQPTHKVSSRPDSLKRRRDAAVDIADIATALAAREPGCPPADSSQNRASGKRQR